MRDIPEYVHRATRNAGESWPDVLADHLRGGMPFQRLPLPGQLRRRDERHVWALVVAGVVVYALVAWRLA